MQCSLLLQRDSRLLHRTWWTGGVYRQGRATANIITLEHITTVSFDDGAVPAQSLRVVWDDQSCRLIVEYQPSATPHERVHTGGSTPTLMEVSTEVTAAVFAPAAHCVRQQANKADKPAAGQHVATDTYNAVRVATDTYNAVTPLKSYFSGCHKSALPAANAHDEMRVLLAMLLTDLC